MLSTPASASRAFASVDVAGALLDGVGIVERQRRQDRVVVADLGPSGEQRVDHLLAVERPGERLADAGFVLEIGDCPGRG